MDKNLPHSIERKYFYIIRQMTRHCLVVETIPTMPDYRRVVIWRRTAHAAQQWADLLNQQHYQHYCDLLIAAAAIDKYPK